MAGHTPGPWHHSKDVMWGCATTKPGGQGEPICSCHNVDECSKDTVMANARLIAAAPDLLEACEAAEPHIGNDHRTIKQMLRDAIAKAKL